MSNNMQGQITAATTAVQSAKVEMDKAKDAYLKAFDLAKKSNDPNLIISTASQAQVDAIRKYEEKQRRLEILKMARGAHGGKRRTHRKHTHRKRAHRKRKHTRRH